MMVNNNDWLLVSIPLNHISQWEGLSHILWKINMFETTNQHCSIHMKWGLQPWDLAALPIFSGQIQHLQHLGTKDGP